MKKRTAYFNRKYSIKSMDRINKYSGHLCKESSIDMIEELSLRFPYICVIDNEGWKYEISLIKGGKRI
ncbi:MAG: hypothetical protein PHS04_14735 [Tissierellia bacterium]|jgi:hypothetical protein|nr:hypothetical protein [Tissierellia bacterium]